MCLHLNSFQWENSSCSHTYVSLFENNILKKTKLNVIIELKWRLLLSCVFFFQAFSFFFPLGLHDEYGCSSSEECHTT